MNGFPRAEFGSTNMQEHRRVFGLEILRVFCAILVVFNHINNYISEFSSICKYTFPIGYVAQDLFFGLSGFLIAKRLADIASGALPVSTFLIYRWVRTVPLFYIFLIINFLIYTFIYSSSNNLLFTNTEFNLLDYFLFIQNFNKPHPFFYPEIWSIAIEEWCFLIYPLVIKLIKMVMPNKKSNSINALFILGLGFILVITIYRIITCSHSQLNVDWDIRKVVLLRLDALAYGVIIYALIVKAPNFFERFSSLLAKSGLFFAICISFAERIFPGSFFNATIFTLIPLLVSMVLPYFYFCNFNFISKYWKGIFSHLSLISYAVLLIHLYLLQFLMLLVYKPTSLIQCMIFTVVYFFFILFFSTFVYNRIERPLINMRSRAAEFYYKLKYILFK